MIVDAHTHASDLWYEPVELLLTQMDLNGVDKAVLVQLGGQYESNYQRACVATHPDRLSSVVLVDPLRPDVVDALEVEAEAGARGVRLSHTHFEHPDVLRRVWATLERLGLSVSLTARPAVLRSRLLAELVETHPDVWVAAEHLGDARRNNPALTAEDIAETCAAIAGLPQVLLKVHGLGEASSRRRPLAAPPYADAPSALLRAFDDLGPTRLMWGSDYPPVSGREGYANALRYTRDALTRHGLDAAGERAVFADNAARVFFSRG